MEIFESLDHFCLENLDETNDWYTWKINESKIPVNIILPTGNQYLKNIILKEKLHKAWEAESDIKKKGEIIKYYIKDWGGIGTNSDDSMKIYMYSSPDTLIEYGKKGIPSWSKALVIHNPHIYAIFDARVSISLNCLQIIYNIADKELFPILASRNKAITEGQKIIKQISKQNHWKKVDKTMFYLNYLTLLKKVARNRNKNLSTIEMLLFAKAEYLVNKIKNFA